MTARIVFIGVALAAGLIGFMVLRSSWPKDPVPADLSLPHVAENAESKDFKQLMAGGRRLKIVELNEGIEREPQNAELRVQRALLYGLMGDNDAALGDIEVALRLDSSRRSYLLFLRHLQLEQLGRLKEALADVLAAIELAPPEISYHWNAAELHRQLGNTEAGVAVLDAGVRKYPGDLSLRTVRARYIASLGRYEEALSEITLAIEKEPDESQRHLRTYDRIIYLTELRRFDEALEEANRLLKKDRRDSIALGARGSVYEAMGDDRRAEADYDAAMSIRMDR